MVSVPAPAPEQLPQPAAHQGAPAGDELAARFPCDVCGQRDFECIARHDRHGRPLDTVLCRTCGLVRHRSIPTAEQLARYYARQYRQQYHGELVPSPRRVMRAWRNGQRIVRQLAACVPAGARVLEIGSGLGATVKSFELAGYDAVGIDPGEAFCRYGAEQLRARVACAELFDLPPEPAYDVVLLVHVIEHLPSPRQALQHIRRLLVSGGWLYVECPNLAAPFAPRGRMFHVAHIYNFTPDTLAALARDCGFEVQRRFGPAHDPNLQLLLRRSDVARPAAESPAVVRAGAARLEVGPGQAEADAVRGILARSGPWRYHLRPRYLVSRSVKLATYAWEHLTARRFVRKLLVRCTQSPRQPALATPPAAHESQRRPPRAA
jgi:SAM-dependent methyltransferase